MARTHPRVLHSAFESDLGVERLPSGKFATDAFALACTTLAYDILRWMGRTGLQETAGGPLRHSADQRRIRTVIQELMYLATRVIESGRRLGPGFGRYCGSEQIFASLHGRLGFTWRRRSRPPVRCAGILSPRVRQPVATVSRAAPSPRCPSPQRRNQPANPQPR